MTFVYRSPSDPPRIVVEKRGGGGCNHISESVHQEIMKRYWPQKKRFFVKDFKSKFQSKYVQNILFL